MSKKKAIKADDSNVLKLVVVNQIHELVKAGKINNTLLTVKEIDLNYKGKVAVYSPGHEDEAVLFQVKSVAKVGHGYLPDGYPESSRVRGSSQGATIMRVTPLDETVEIPTEESIEERAPSADEGAE